MARRREIHESSVTVHHAPKFDEKMVVEESIASASDTLAVGRGFDVHMLTFAVD
jgi:hypothetical protein